MAFTSITTVILAPAQVSVCMSLKPPLFTHTLPAKAAVRSMDTMYQTVKSQHVIRESPAGSKHYTS